MRTQGVARLSPESLIGIATALHPGARMQVNERFAANRFGPRGLPSRPATLRLMHLAWDDRRAAYVFLFAVQWARLKSRLLWVPDSMLSDFLGLLSSSSLPFQFSVL
jgi:hypothetical protein